MAFKCFLSSQPYLFPAQHKCTALSYAIPFRCDVNSRTGSFLGSAPVVLSFFCKHYQFQTQNLLQGYSISLNFILAVQHLFLSFLPNFCMLFINVIKEPRDKVQGCTSALSHVTSFCQYLFQSQHLKARSKPLIFVCGSKQL